MDEEKPPEGPPKLRIVKGPRGISIDHERYEQMAEAYLSMKPRSARGLVRATGVNIATALKAINFGWPNRQWSSLKDRAKIFDAERASETEKKAARTAAELMDEQLYIAQRLQQFNMMRALRHLAMAVAEKLNGDLAGSVSTRQGKRTRVIDVVVGVGKKQRIVQRVVQEDVVLPPYTPDLAGAVRELAGVIVQASGAEQRLFHSKIPEGVPKPKVDLTDEQIDFMVKNGGKLPPGVTREQLGWA